MHAFRMIYHLPVLLVMVALLVPKAGSAQDACAAVLKEIRAGHTGQGSFGYLVTAKSVAPGNEAVARYKMYGQGTAYLYMYEGAKLDQFISGDTSIRIDHNQKVIIVESVQAAFSLEALWDADMEKQISEVSCENAGTHRVVRMTRTDGSSYVITYEPATGHLVRMNVRSQLPTGEEVLSEVAFTPIISLPAGIARQEYIEIKHSSIHPTEKYKDYEVFNVLF